MGKQPMGSGFRFRKIMAWGPAILIMFGVLLIATGAMYAGLTVAMAGVVFGIMVKRRARSAVAGASPVDLPAANRGSEAPARQRPGAAA